MVFHVLNRGGGVAGVGLATVSEPPARQPRIWGVALGRRPQPPLSCNLRLNHARGQTRIRLQLVNFDSLTSDGLVRQPAIEPSLGPKPRLLNLEERPAACRKNYKKTAKEIENRRGPTCHLVARAGPR